MAISLMVRLARDDRRTHAKAHTEASLAQLEAVQARLAQNARDLQAEIDSLQDELSKEQDSNRMQIIQEMISVRVCASRGWTVY